MGRRLSAVQTNPFQFNQSSIWAVADDTNCFDDYPTGETRGEREKSIVKAVIGTEWQGEIRLVGLEIFDRVMSAFDLGLALAISQV